MSDHDDYAAWIRVSGGVNVHTVNLLAENVTPEEFVGELLADYRARGVPATLVKEVRIRR